MHQIGAVDEPSLIVPTTTDTTQETSVVVSCSQSVTRSWPLDTTPNQYSWMARLAAAIVNGAVRLGEA